MDTFLTWETLLTYAGCLAWTILFTEFVKKLAPKLIPQLVSLAISIITIICGHLALNTFVVNDIPLYLFNAVAVSFAANGGFDAIDKIFGKTKVINDELIVDSTIDGENAEVYLNVANDPKLYNDGEILTFRVKKVSQK